MPSVALPYRTTNHTFIKVCAVVPLEVVTMYRENHTIHCRQMVSTQVSAFLNVYVGGGG